MLLGKKPIGTCTYMGGVLSTPEPFTWSWGQMVEYNKEYLVESNQSIYYYRSTISYHVYARNNIVDQMKGDWLLMLDTDIQFEPDLTNRMLVTLNKYNLDVLVGMYVYRNEVHSPVLFMWNKKGDFLEPLGRWDISNPDEEYLIPIGSAGAGCLLVRKKVFERIRKELKQGPFDIIHPFSEDHSFFKRLQKLKIQPYCNPKIEVYHFGFKSYSIDDYDPNQVLLSKKRKFKGGD